MSVRLNNPIKSKTKWQITVRQLLIVMTVVAIVVMLVTHHFRFVIGCITVAFWLADPFFPFVELFVASWLNPRRWPPYKPTEAEKQEFAARYPKRPDRSSE